MASAQVITVPTPPFTRDTGGWSDADRAYRLYLAAVDLRESDPYAAIGLLDEAVDLVDELPGQQILLAEYLFARASAYYIGGDRNAAQSDMSWALELDDTRAEFYALQAQVMLDQSDYEAAVENATRAIELNPENAEHFAIRARAQYARTFYQLAIRDFSTAIRLNPDGFWYYAERGYTYSTDSKPRQAIDDFEEAIRRGQDEAEMRAAIGEAYLMLGGPVNMLNASQSFQRAVELNDSVPYYYRRLADIQYDLGRDRASAARLYRRYIELAEAVGETVESYVLDRLAELEAEGL
jgi:tetratricopeptide (TPR) repeat protein